jgi:hypothetical protein
MKRTILSIFTVMMVFSLAGCGGLGSKAEALGKKKCECEKLRKKANRSDSDRQERAYKKCKYERKAMEAEMELALFDKYDKYWGKGYDEIPESVRDEMEAIESIYEEAYDKSCNYDD